MNEVFKWEFTDWGPKYISFSGANIDGGFNGEGDAQVSNGGCSGCYICQRSESNTGVCGKSWRRNIKAYLMIYPEAKDSISVTQTGMNLQYGQNNWS